MILLVSLKKETSLWSHSFLAETISLFCIQYRLCSWKHPEQKPPVDRIKNELIINNYQSSGSIRSCNSNYSLSLFEKNALDGFVIWLKNMYWPIINLDFLIREIFEWHSLFHLSDLSWLQIDCVRWRCSDELLEFGRPLMNSFLVEISVGKIQNDTYHVDQYVRTNRS